MKKEIAIFLTAVMFLTRIKIPKKIYQNNLMLQESVRYFPWVGLLVGSVAALVLYVSQLILSPALSILFSMLAGIVVTGAFHEDGFADVCDAFGGGWTKEKILLIMKDSRLGTFGVIGLVSILSFKFLLLFDLLISSESIRLMLVIIVAGHSVSRFIAVTLMSQYSYVTGTDSKSGAATARRPTLAELLISFSGTLLPFLFLDHQFVYVLIPLIVARILVGRYFFKWIGGYTGDCLGAMQQVSEIIFYLGCLLIWKYI